MHLRTYASNTARSGVLGHNPCAYLAERRKSQTLHVHNIVWYVLCNYATRPPFKSWRGRLLCNFGRRPQPKTPFVQKSRTSTTWSEHGNANLSLPAPLTQAQRKLFQHTILCPIACAPSAIENMRPLSLVDCGVQADLVMHTTQSAPLFAAQGPLSEARDQAPSSRVTKAHNCGNVEQ